MGIGSPRLRQLLRAACATALAIVAGAAAAGSAARAPAAVAPAIVSPPLERAFVAAINAVRAGSGAPPLRLSHALHRAARSHAVDMLARDYLGHGDFAGRLARFGARGPLLGENLGWSTDPGAAVSFVVGAWARSPMHRTILLRRGFRRLGVGVAVGVFRGHAGALVVTADFAGG